MGRVGSYQLSAALRSGIRFEIAWVIEPQGGGYTPAPVEAQLNLNVYDVPRFETGLDHTVQFNMPISRFLAQFDGTSNIACDFRVDLHYALDKSDVATGDILLELEGWKSVHNAGEKVGLEILTTPVQHTLAEDTALLTVEGEYKSTRDIANASYGLIVPKAELNRDTFWTFKLTRRGSDVADTYAGNFYLPSLELFFYYSI